jgi:enoyl-CoA hydratase
VIRSERRGRVAELVIDRPERRNALDVDHCRQLRAAIDEAAGDGARCLVVTGEGRAFCAGADLGGVYGPDFRVALYGLLGRMTSLPIPIVAAVNGPAIGAGTQLAIAADLRVADRSARFAVPTARLGLAVDPWTVRRLSLLAGGGPARALLIGCAELDAEAAHRLGLVDRRGDLDTARAWAAEIAGLAPLTHAYNKLALERLTEPEAYDAQLDAAFEATWASQDFVEGRAASAEKRPPNFEGR